MLAGKSEHGVALAPSTEVGLNDAASIIDGGPARPAREVRVAAEKRGAAKKAADKVRGRG